jgi:hypothetical protein
MSNSLVGSVAEAGSFLTEEFTPSFYQRSAADKMGVFQDSTRYDTDEDA